MPDVFPRVPTTSQLTIAKLVEGRSDYSQLIQLQVLQLLLSAISLLSASFQCTLFVFDAIVKLNYRHQSIDWAPLTSFYHLSAIDTITTVHCTC